MPPIPQAQISTLPLLYAIKRLMPAGQPLYASSSALNAKVGLIRADITTLELKNGAIVNAANRRLLGGGGVDGAIHRAAGPALFQECRGLGGAHTGQSKITDAYKLPCKKIIHTVGPVYDMEDDAQKLLASCYQTSLELAVEAGLNAIAFSAVSTGIYGYPSAKAARVALKTVRQFLETDDGKKLDLVVFCNFEMKDVNAYHELTPFYFPPEASNARNVSQQEDKAEDTAPKGETEKVEDAAVDEAKVTEGNADREETADENVEEKAPEKKKIAEEQVTERNAVKGQAADECDEGWVKV